MSTNREKIRAITEYTRAHIQAMRDADWTWEEIGEQLRKTHSWAHQLMKPGGQHKALDLDTVITIAEVVAKGSVDELIRAAERREKPKDYRREATPGLRPAHPPVKAARLRSKKTPSESERARSAKGRPSG